jgi:hypothetical protein
LRHELADRLDEHPVRQWSPPFLRAVIALFDLDESPQGPPAPVLQLVGPSKGRRP